MTSITAYTNEIHQGDARDVLTELPTDSVHFVMFSPPYYGLRDYGVDGQIGLEESLEEFIEEITSLCSEVKRVLRQDGSFWLNIGDTYASSPSGHQGEQDLDGGEPESHPRRDDSQLSMPTKSRMFVPHRIALRLIEDGWILHSDAVWKKSNPMPEPVTDRLSTTFEWVYHFTLTDDYYFDPEPVQETSSDNSKMLTGDIFEMATDGSSEGHFAVYPPELVQLPMRATCPKMVCAECHTPYSGTEQTQQCDCNSAETQGGVSLDPMCGRGTTCKVAVEEGRQYVGIELNDEYVKIAEDYIPETTQQTLDSLF